MLLSDGVKRRHFGQHTARSSISEGGLVCIADGLGKTLQSLFLHRATLTNSTLRRLGSGLSQLREMSMTDLTQIDRGNKLSILARPRKKSRFATHKSSLGAMKLETSTSLSAMRFRLRKLELSSVSGFTDLDIANFLSGFPLLQWVDLSFSFTYPRTLKVITDHCQYLSYLRLCALPNCKVQTPLSRQRRVSTTSPTRNSKKTVCSPYIPNSRNSLVPEYLIPSHPECRSFVRFAERGGRRLKVLDLTGELGINNFTLSALGSLPCLHTMFLDSIPRLSGDAVVKLVQRKASGNLEQDINSATANEFFGRSGLKRLYIRHCVGLQFTKIQRQKLIEGFKLELVVDGSRPMGSSVIEGEGMGEAEDDLSEIGDGPATGTNEPLIGEAEHENTEETEPLLS
ncbi:hypothetical protein BJ742DRAFT_859556 [Cladochytrium replicatum]|nr:hypothetical protein BJ742DRAFT_859556 [Cladochytrium replicatum]